jgi:hypothetical protein
LFLFVPKRIPAKIRPERSEIDNLIPNTGISTPEIRMNPKAEPARSELYTEAASDPSSSEIVSFLKR